MVDLLAEGIVPGHREVVDHLDKVGIVAGLFDNGLVAVTIYICKQVVLNHVDVDVRLCVTP